MQFLCAKYSLWWNDSLCLTGQKYSVASTCSAARRWHKIRIYNHQEITVWRHIISKHFAIMADLAFEKDRVRRAGLALQEMINADAASKISNGTDHRYSACNWVCVNSYTKSILTPRSWWVWGPHFLGGSPFEVWCRLIIYLSGVESGLTRVFLQSSSHVCFQSLTTHPCELKNRVYFPS